MSEPASRLPAGDAEGDCPVTAASAVIGKKWHPVIVDRLLAEGPLRYNELQSSVGGISGKVLSESLEDLQDKQLVERTVIEDRPPHVEYSLTACGAGLEPIIDAMAEWGEEYLVETADRTESAA